MDNQPDEAEFMRITQAVMEDPSGIFFLHETRELWLIISCIQLAWRSRGLSKPMRRTLRKIASALSEPIIEVYPEAKRLLDMGWDTRRDVKVEDK